MSPKIKILRTQVSSSASSIFQNMHFYKHSFNNSLVLRVLPSLLSFSNLFCSCFDLIPLSLLKMFCSIIPALFIPSCSNIVNLLSLLDSSSPQTRHTQIRSHVFFLGGGEEEEEEGKRKKASFESAFCEKYLFSQLIICQLIVYSL